MISFLGSAKRSYLGGDLGRDPGEELCSLPQLSLAGDSLLLPGCVSEDGVKMETWPAVEMGVAFQVVR